MPLIVFEGIDGCGKGTQIDLLQRRLAERGLADLVVFNKQPGGTQNGRAISGGNYEHDWLDCPSCVAAYEAILEVQSAGPLEPNLGANLGANLHELSLFTTFYPVKHGVSC